MPGANHDQPDTPICIKPLCEIGALLALAECAVLKQSSIALKVGVSCFSIPAFFCVSYITHHSIKDACDETPPPQINNPIPRGITPMTSAMRNNNPRGGMAPLPPEGMARSNSTQLATPLLNNQ